jgi:chaperone modulatory protein CbpM
MNQPTHETCIVEEHLELGLDELGRACHCSREWIVTLVREGVLAPTDPRAAEWRFAGESLRRARQATRLQRELELETPALALVLELLDRIEALERRLR